MKALILLILTVFITDVAFSQGSKRQLQNLSGDYTSLKAEDWGRGTFGYRKFSFDQGKWSLSFVLALDPGMQAKVFEFRTYGSYKILGRSKAVKAYDAIFYEDKKFVTLMTEDTELARAFGLQVCGLIPFKEKDISVDGCSIWPSVKDCYEDHDLLAMDKEGLLFFGVRPADNNMCTADKRPKALLPPVKKTSHDTF